VSDGLEATVAVRLGPLDLQVELTVVAGETVAVLGPNGAGKTTLLRALAGLQRVDDGSVVLDGEVLDGDPSTRSVGVVFQEHRLFPHLSLLENVAFGPRARGIVRATARATAQSWLDRVGLGARSHDRPSTLSGGESQRVALARALATEPRLLLLDEPLSALDATTRPSLRRVLADALAAHDGVGILVTHDPLEARALADRLVILEGGRVVQDGSGSALTARPGSAFVADLVGVNLLSGSSASASGHEVRLGSRLVLVAADPVGVVGGVSAVVHPRSVSLHRSPPEGSARNVFEGSATAVDLDVDGGRARVRVALDDGIAIVAEVTSSAVDDLRLHEGGRVWASVKATEVTVYPR
jgi:molybdate transport system ATP-binding protein